MLCKLHRPGTALALILGAATTLAQHELGNTSATNTTPADLAIKRFEIAPGFKVELFAAEPHLANPVAIHVDELGRCWVVETHRLHKGVPDIRGRREWPSKAVLNRLPADELARLDETLLVEDLALRTVQNRIDYFKKWKGSEVSTMEAASESLRLVIDSNMDFRADRSTVFATNFNTIADGIASGVITRGDKAWFANIPNLWLLEDRNADGVADIRESLHFGYGVRTGFLGHDLHGLAFGPDGRLYFSIGDRGAHVKTRDGRVVDTPDTGAVFRCEPDGSNLEIFHSGLRNPQELTFDEHGNWFTGDNNSDGGDQARIVHLVQGGDSGWRIGWQFLERPNSRGPWNSEKMWHPQNPYQPAYLVPPITNITSGPSGFTYNPGTALGPNEARKFYLVDFRGSPSTSGIHSFRLNPKGASFSLVDHERPLWSILATDACFGPDGALYVSDWIEGWGMTGKGRVYRMFDPATVNSAGTASIRQILAGGMAHHTRKQLLEWLAFPDQRVRLAAQYELAERTAPANGKSRASVDEAGLKALQSAAVAGPGQLARIHAIWALGQVGRRGAAVNETLATLLADPDAEIRAQAALTIGDNPASTARSRFSKNLNNALAGLLRDTSPRVRMMAGLALGNGGTRDAVPALLEMLRANDDTDPYLRHAGVMGLAGIGDKKALASAAADASPAVRMGVLLAMRRLNMPEVAGFLNDREQRIVEESARAINDLPMAGLDSKLAALIDRPASSIPVGRRVLNATFRQGKAANAQALARVAADSNTMETLRVDALQLLASWTAPSQRDPVNGLWRPLTARDARPAASALEPVLAGMLSTAPGAVQLAAVGAAGSLGIQGAASQLADVLADRKRSGELRAAALRALVAMKSSRVAGAFAMAAGDKDEKVRLEAMRIANRAGSEVFQPLMNVLETGGIPERQAAITALSKIPGEAADAAIADWVDRLASRRVPSELTLELIEAAETRSKSPKVRQQYDRYKSTLAKDDPLGAFRSTLAGGDREAGRRVFLENETASCVRCHKVENTGGDVAPALDGIASRVNREYLLESIVLPNKVIAPGFENTTITLKNGSNYVGVIKKETADELQVHSPEDGIVTVKKADITAREKGVSGMLPDLANLLTKRELRDLIEFLASLKSNP